MREWRRRIAAVLSLAAVVGSFDIPNGWSLPAMQAVPVAPIENRPPIPEGTEVSPESIDRLRQSLRLRPADAQAKAELIRALNSFAILQMNQGNLLAARVSLTEAISLNKRDTGLLTNLAVVYLRLNDFANAEETLQASLAIDGSNLDMHYLLGLAFYNSDRLTEAIDEWTAGLRLGPHPQMSRNLEKATKEAAVRDQLGEMRSSHFILRYHTKVSHHELGQQILRQLDRLYAELTADLFPTPPTSITVILYPDQSYFDITRAPSWSGAVFDGRIRVPIKGLDSVTPRLIAVLKHELTHAFLAALPQGFPAWFNEGLAQLEEGRLAINPRVKLDQARPTQALIPLKNLSRPFSAMPAAEAEIAYVESLSALDYVVRHSGKTSVKFILQLMSQHYRFEDAFQTAVRQSLAEFEASWQQELSR